MKRHEELEQIRFLNSQPEEKYKKIFCWYLVNYVDERVPNFFSYEELDLICLIPIDDRYFYMKHVLDILELGWTWFNNQNYITSHERYADICEKYEVDDYASGKWSDTAFNA